jgi:hypothetical protein
MQGFWLRVVFAKKHLRVSPCFQVLASSSTRLTILGKQQSKSHMVEKQLTEHPTRLIIIIVPLLTLCGKRVK